MSGFALSPETLQILKNMAAINPSLKFTAGNVLRTVAPAGSILMEATVAETFPVDFSIYELSKLLTVLNLPNMKGAELHFDDPNNAKMTIKAAKAKIDYFFTSNKFTAHPGKQIALPSVDLEVIVTEADLDSFTKAASALDHKILEFRAEGGKAYLVASTPALDTSNDYVQELELDASKPVPVDGSYKIKADSFKVLPGDYLIQICGKGIMSCKHQTREVIYHFGLERV